MLSNSESEDQDDSLITSNGANYFNTMSNTSISTSSNSFSSPINNYQMHQQVQQQQLSSNQPPPQPPIDNSSFQLMSNSLQLLNDITQINNTKLQEQQQTSYFDLSNSIGNNCYNMPSIIAHSIQQNQMDINVSDIKHFENLV